MDIMSPLKNHPTPTPCRLDDLGSRHWPFWGSCFPLNHKNWMFDEIGHAVRNVEVASPTEPTWDNDRQCLARTTTSTAKLEHVRCISSFASGQVATIIIGTQTPTRVCLKLGHPQFWWLIVLCPIETADLGWYKIIFRHSHKENCLELH